MNRKWNSINSKETERSKIEIETEFLQFSNPRSKTKVKMKLKAMETKKLKFTQVQKLSQNYYENSKRKAPRIT